MNARTNGQTGNTFCPPAQPQAAALAEASLRLVTVVQVDPQLASLAIVHVDLALIASLSLGVP